MTQKRSAARSRAGIPKKSARKDERVTHKGHEIVIPSDAGRRVLVDGEPIRHRQVGDEFYLDATTVPKPAICHDERSAEPGRPSALVGNPELAATIRRTIQSVGVPR